MGSGSGVGWAGYGVVCGYDTLVGVGVGVGGCTSMKEEIWQAVAQLLLSCHFQLSTVCCARNFCQLYC